MDLMLDLETLSAAPNATILTIAAQGFDPLARYTSDTSYYARIQLEGQEKRAINESTIEWWGTQKEAAAEAFAEDGRIPLKQSLEELGKLIWKSNRVWSKGSFDFVILENAYVEHGMNLPWKFWTVRDARTVLSLWPDCPIPPIAHHALMDCRAQITQVQQTLAHLGVKEMK
jgi:hypothetical protein